jgi:hypothetical protein
VIAPEKIDLPPGEYTDSVPIGFTLVVPGPGVYLRKSKDGDKPEKIAVPTKPWVIPNWLKVAGLVAALLLAEGYLHVNPKPTPDPDNPPAPSRPDWLPPDAPPLPDPTPLATPQSIRPVTIEPVNPVRRGAIQAPALFPEIYR